MQNFSTLESIIKSNSLVVKESTPPLIVVGLPRSGSSYLAHILCCLDGWFVFDDLLPYQKAAALGISSSLNLANKRESLKKFINSLTWQLRAKIKFEENFYVPNLEWDDTFLMQSALLHAVDEEYLITWPKVLEEWTMRLVIHCGKNRWGYKSAQDVMHMDELTDIFPGVKFIYIFRDPRKMMRSYKNLPKGNQDGESQQYHPIVYSLYWKKSYEKVQDFIRRGVAPVEIVKFEEMIKNPEEVAARLAKFLDTEVVGNVVVDQVNSSFKQVSSKKELTNTEIMLCEKIAGSWMQAAGYDLSNPTPSWLDIFDLTGTSAVFIMYQVKRMVKDKRARASIITFIKSLIEKRQHQM